MREVLIFSGATHQVLPFTLDINMVILSEMFATLVEIMTFLAVASDIDYYPAGPLLYN